MVGNKILLFSLQSITFCFLDKEEGEGRNNLYNCLQIGDKDSNNAVLIIDYWIIHCKKVIDKTFKNALSDNKY